MDVGEGFGVGILLVASGSSYGGTGGAEGAFSSMVAISERFRDPSQMDEKHQHS